MGKGLFITGTDTGIGKTFVTGVMVLGLTKCGVDTGIMKPVETGCPYLDGVIHPVDATFLQEAADVKDELDLINPFRFKTPVAPSIAARIEGKDVDFDVIARSYTILSTRHEIVLVEGVGGLLVPLSGSKTVADLVVALDLPAVLVAGCELGTINHTLLSLRCAEESGIEVAGIVFNRNSPESEEQEGFMEEIGRFTTVPAIGTVPYCKDRVAIGAAYNNLDLSILTDLAVTARKS